MTVLCFFEHQESVPSFIIAAQAVVDAAQHTPLPSFCSPNQVIESTLIPPKAPYKMETDFNEHMVTVRNISSCFEAINVFPTSPPRLSMSPLLQVSKLGKPPVRSSSNTIASQNFFAKEKLDAAEESRLFHQFTTDENRILMRSVTAQATLIFPDAVQARQDSHMLPSKPVKNLTQTVQADPDFFVSTPTSTCGQVQTTLVFGDTEVQRVTGPPSVDPELSTFRRVEVQKRGALHFHALYFPEQACKSVVTPKTVVKKGVRIRSPPLSKKDGGISKSRTNCSRSGRVSKATPRFQ